MPAAIASRAVIVGDPSRIVQSADECWILPGALVDYELVPLASKYDAAADIKVGVFENSSSSHAIRRMKRAVLLIMAEMVLERACHVIPPSVRDGQGLARPEWGKQQDGETCWSCNEANDHAVARRQGWEWWWQWRCWWNLGGRGAFRGQWRSRGR